MHDSVAIGLKPKSSIEKKSKNSKRKKKYTCNGGLLNGCTSRAVVILIRLESVWYDHLIVESFVDKKRKIACLENEKRKFFVSVSRQTIDYIVGSLCFRKSWLLW